jgi:carboxyl-terminal processing protease
MKNHFLNRHLYSEEDWSKMYEQFVLYDDKHQAVKSFMERFNDPYTRFIPKQIMATRQQCIRGQAVGLGLMLKRRIYWNEVTSAIRLLLPLRNNNQFYNTNSETPSQSKTKAGLSGKLLALVSRLNLANKQRDRDTTMSTVPHTPNTSHLITLNDRLRFISDTTLPLALSFLYSNNKVLWQRQVIILGGIALSILGATRRIMPIIRPAEIEEIIAPSIGKGLMPNDRIVSIDGKRTQGLSLKSLAALLDNGNVGDQLSLGVVRNMANEKKTYLEVKLARDYVITRKVFSSSLPPTQGKGVGYLAITEFTDKTFIEVTNAIKLLKEKLAEEQDSSLNCLIIDLRGNPGGPLTPALDLASYFLSHGKIVTKMSIQGKLETHRSTNFRPDRRTSLLLLADETTASASEIFIAALQDNNRAKCVGGRTVGKNIAQAMMTLSDGSGVAFTVREYLSPIGKSMSDGIVPDFEVIGPIDINTIRFDDQLKRWNVIDANYNLYPNN